MTLEKYIIKKNIHIRKPNNQFIFNKFHKLQKADNKQRNIQNSTKNHNEQYT